MNVMMEKHTRTALEQRQWTFVVEDVNLIPQGASFVELWKQYTNGVAITLSIHSEDGQFALYIEKTLKMLPLTEPQMREFVRGYLGEEGDRLFQQLQGDRLRKFAETPLLLWMLCRVFAHNGDDWAYIRAQVRQNLDQANPHA